MPADQRSRDLLQRQHGRLCDVLEQVPPEAPTLCEGWTASDLAAHLWQLKHDPVSWVGGAHPSLGRRFAGRQRALLARLGYDGLVDDLRRGPADFACMPGDRWGGFRHALGENYVHEQDVARANGLEQPRPGEDLQDALWLRAQAAGRALWALGGFRGPSYELCRPNGEIARIGPRPTVRVVGDPTELLLWVHGRTAHAHVTSTSR